MPGKPSLKCLSLPASKCSFPAIFKLNLPMPQKKEGYWINLSRTVRSVLGGLGLTGRHIIDAFVYRGKIGSVNIRNSGYFENQKGITTLQYPHEQMPVPENGRYKLHNEIDDCIVCDKCVKVCPVNCITIDAIRSPEEFGKTSDGTSKRIYASRFDIDMAKCCFCGLCTTVCPTECLTMTPDYAFSSFSLKDHQFEFAEMTETEIEQRKKEWQDHLASKESAVASTSDQTIQPKPAPKPVFKPIMKPAPPKPPTDSSNE